MTMRLILSGRLLLLLLLLGQAWPSLAQAPKRWTSAEIQEGLHKLNFLGSVLYVAAHPDDENTRMIAYLANKVRAETTYLSLTRGDGGQNLIGPEIAELLGVIRTQELLAARRTDGGRQMFSRANDFGFSKHPDETVRIWNRDEVLSDVVWAIRKLQPDIIINRFDHRTAGNTHGHHTASGVLAFEAFDISNDAAAYPGQLQHVQPWQPRRLFFNTSWWFYGSRDKFASADKSNLIATDIGVYYPALGKSNTEIAAESRSQHRCQGMGSTPTRGTEMDYLELLKGDKPQSKNDLFEGINTTWTRLKGGAPIGQLLERTASSFRPDRPWESVADLAKAWTMMKALPDSYWKRTKMNDTQELIKACLALFTDAVASESSATPGETVELTLEFTNRSPLPVTLQSLRILPTGLDTTLSLVLDENAANQLSYKVALPTELPFTNAYWLNKKWELGMYEVDDQRLRGLPETPRDFKVQYTVLVQGVPITYEQEVAYKATDPVYGQVYQPFEVIPPVSVNVSGQVYVFATGQAQDVQVLLKAGRAGASGTLELAHGAGWRTEPAQVDFAFKEKGEEKLVGFKLFPPAQQDESLVRPLVRMDGKTYSQELRTIKYDHIPTQTIYRDAAAKAVRVDLKKEGQHIGYIMGAGDDIPASLQQMGYTVTTLGDGEIMNGDLEQYDAIVLGVRAYNTVERIKFYQPRLMAYVQGGGTVIVQYNTSHQLNVPADQLGPYPLKISRERVAVEEAEVRFLLPEHPVLNYPNKITAKDFEGWVQERGLYFPNEWDERYAAVLSCNDPGEPARDGGLLVAKYGEGHYIYTGYSWFRELPAGVPGAFRMFANMISVGKQGAP